jgi:hypothetical protein
MTPTRVAVSVSAAIAAGPVVMVIVARSATGSSRADRVGVAKVSGDNQSGGSIRTPDDGRSAHVRAVLENALLPRLSVG